MDEEIENGFSHLPAGCVLNLERLAREYVLENVRQAVSHNRNRLVRRIASFEAETGTKLTLQSFLAYHRLNLDEIYQRDCWSRLCVQARVDPAFAEPDTDRLAKGLRRVAHLNGAQQIRALLETLPPGRTRPSLNPAEESPAAFAPHAPLQPLDSRMVSSNLEGEHCPPGRKSDRLR